MRRLGLDEGEPLAVQQWQSGINSWCLGDWGVDLAIGLIAVNYPAREFGVSRHVRYSSDPLLSIRGIALTLLYVHSPLQQMP